MARVTHVNPNLKTHNIDITNVTQLSEHVTQVKRVDNWTFHKLRQVCRSTYLANTQPKHDMLITRVMRVDTFTTRNPFSPILTLLFPVDLRSCFHDRNCHFLEKIIIEKIAYTP